LQQKNYAEAASGSDVGRRLNRTNNGAARNARIPGSAASHDSVEQLVETNLATEQAVLDLAKNVLNITLDRGDISVAHRLAIPCGAKPGQPAPILVCFLNRRSPNALFSVRMSLKQHLPGIYINEHLTKHCSSLFKEVRSLVKAMKLAGAWTSNGNEFIRLSNLPDSKPIQVDSLADLPRG